MRQIQTLLLSPRDFIVGIGRVMETKVFHNDVAVLGPTPHEKPNLKGSLLMARLACEAVEHCYKSVPDRVMVRIGHRWLTFDADAMVNVADNSLALAKAA